MPGWVPFSPNHISSTLDPEDVPAALESAERALAAGDSATAIEWLLAASRTSGLATETRDQVQTLLEQACARRIETLAADPEGADELGDMVDIGLPRQLAVEAGLAAATRMVAEHRGLDAYEVLKKLDTKFPLHHERQRAGDLMCDIGLLAIADGPGFLGFWSDRDEGQGILEYVILQAPWAKRCDEAYRALYQYYENDREWDLAITRAEQLVLNHPGSPLRPAAQARVPHMRLESITSPEYDRAAIAKARTELQEWLLAYSGSKELAQTGNADLEQQVRVELGDALRRLSDNDLIVSRFYDRVDVPYGARYHAERAIEEAREAGDEGRVAEAQAWLAELPPAAEAPGAVP
jgi:hypothetical protein